MNIFILAITTYNRISYLKDCIQSWQNTKSENYSWIIIIADDGSTDGTIEYIESLNIKNTEIVIIKNQRFGVHQQMNTILSYLENIHYDFCFKIDDDIKFLNQGWDELYYQTAKETGNHHLVFCDKNWCTEQFLRNPIKTQNLIAHVSMLNVHGFFYTFSPEVIEKVGYMDVSSFGYRGMGHVDFTMRCARAGFTNKETPWDIVNSNNYLSASKQNYKSVLPSTATKAYDQYKRSEKEAIISENNRIYIGKQATQTDIHEKFKEELINALSDKLINFEQKKKELISWYDTEIIKIKDWYSNQYNHLPNWYLRLGKIFKLFK